MIFIRWLSRLPPCEIESPALLLDSLVISLISCDPPSGFMSLVYLFFHWFCVVGLVVCSLEDSHFSVFVYRFIPVLHVVLSVVQIRNFCSPAVVENGWLLVLVHLLVQQSLDILLLVLNKLVRLLKLFINRIIGRLPFLEGMTAWKRSTLLVEILLSH